MMNAARGMCGCTAPSSARSCQWLVHGEQEHAELGAIQAASVRGVDLWPADVLGGFERIRPTMCANRQRPHTVDSRRSIVDAASPRSSIQARNSSMCARLAARTTMPWLVAH
jgi:hypothetical protein